MRKYQIYLLLIFFFSFLLFLEESFFPEVNIFIFSFDFYLISLFLLIFFDKGNLGLNPAILAGIILDTFSFFPFGVFTFSITISSFLTRRISQMFQKSNVFSFLILFGLFFVFNKVFLIFGNYIFNFILEKI